MTTKTKFAKATVSTGGWRQRCTVPYADALRIVNERLTELLGIGRGYAMSVTETSAGATFTITNAGQEMGRILLSDGWINFYGRGFVDIDGVGRINERTRKEHNLGREFARLTIKLEAALVEPGKQTALENTANLPNARMQTSILDAYEKVSGHGALSAPWEGLRSALLQALGEEPPSKPILRKMVYAMWKDQGARTEIERRGLAQIVHKPPNSK